MVFGAGEAALRTPAQDGGRDYCVWKAIRDMGGSDLLEKWGDFAFQLCVAKRELIDPEFTLSTARNQSLAFRASGGQEPGVL